MVMDDSAHEDHDEDHGQSLATSEDCLSLALCRYEWLSSQPCDV